MNLTVDQAVRQGVSYHNEGKLQDAERLYRAVLASYPRHADANHNLGILLSSSGKLEESIVFLSVALEANPDINQFWLSYIDVLLRANKREVALAVIEKARKKGLPREQLDDFALRLASKETRDDPGALVPPEAELKRLMAFYQKGDLEASERLALALTDQYSEHSLAWKVLGAVLRQNGRNIESLVPMERAAQLEPTDPEAHNNLGSILKDLRRLEEAEKSYRRALSLNPNYAEAHYNLGGVFSKLGRLDQAIESYERAIKSNPAFGQAYNNMGLIFREIGKPEEAKKSFEKAIAVMPDFASSHMNLGIILQDLARFPEAKKSYERAITLLPDYAECHYNLGRVYKDLQELEKAEVSYKHAIAIKSNFPEAYDGLGNVLSEQQRFEEAEKSYKRALEKNEDYAEIHGNLGNLYKMQNRLEEAVLSYRRAIELKPSLYEAHSNLGNTMRLLGNLDESEVSCRTAIRIKPDYAEAYMNLSNTLQELGRLHEAEATDRKAIELKPHYAEAHFNLGVTLQEFGKLEDAESSYRDAIALKPDYAEAYGNLGNVLAFRDKLIEAEAGFIKAIELKPEVTNASSNLIELLAIHKTPKNLSHPIVELDQTLKKTQLTNINLQARSNTAIERLLSELLILVRSKGPELNSHLSQVYRRNSTMNLDCKRHMAIFKRSRIIPEYCFGCYKVQAEPKSIAELVNLFILFDQIILPGDNTRKCMIELRPDVSGFYKGLIYCKNLEEANEIAMQLKLEVSERIRSDLKVVVKRGCSEYEIAFPGYDNLARSDLPTINYDERWKDIEDEFDSTCSATTNFFKTPTLRGLSLSDILIIRNWFDYARGLGDESLRLLGHEAVFNKEIYQSALARLDRYSF